MKIVRAPRRRNFTVLDNALIQNVALSFRARGLLAYLLSQPDGWESSADRLATLGVEGRDAMRRALREIELAGYLSRERRRLNGRYAVTWTLHDSPARETSDGEPALENRSGKPADLERTNTKDPLTPRRGRSDGCANHARRRRGCEPCERGVPYIGFGRRPAASRCPTHGVQQQAGGVCPSCRADSLAGEAVAR